MHGNKHGRASGRQPVPSGRTATGGGFQCGLPAAACEARISSRVDSTHATAGIVKGFDSKRALVCDCLRGSGIFNGQQHSGQVAPFKCREGRNIRLQLLKRQPLLPAPLKASFQAFTHLSRRRRLLGCECEPPLGQTAAVQRPASGGEAPQPVQWEVAQQPSWFGPEMQAAARRAAA